jgi:NAD(P)-dependent dehydrogenase (short-subunit alcohol dehydrogenase family)
MEEPNVMSDKRIALVSGANRGVGLEISRQLGAKGHAVIIGSRDSKKGEAAAEDLRGGGADVHVVQLNVGDPASIAAAVATIGERFGVLDVLVNNAGVLLESWGTLPSDITLEQMRATFEVNFFGLFEMTRACLPLLRKSTAARIVNLSTDMASLGTLDDPKSVVYEVWAPAYQASKAAVNALTVLFAKELKHTNIKVNSASPGWARTAMGGEEAPLSAAQGADTAVWLATLPDDGPSGAFFSSSRSRGAIEW